MLPEIIRVIYWSVAGECRGKAALVAKGCCSTGSALSGSLRRRSGLKTRKGRCRVYQDAGKRRWRRRLLHRVGFKHPSLRQEGEFRFSNNCVWVFRRANQIDGEDSGARGCCETLKGWKVESQIVDCCAKLVVVHGKSLHRRCAAILADVLALDCCSSLMPRWRRLLTLRCVSGRG